MSVVSRLPRSSVPAIGTTEGEPPAAPGRVVHRGWRLLGRLAASAAAVLAAPAVLAQAPAAGAAPVAAVAVPQRVTSVEGITEYRLPNGLQVLLVPDPSKPTTTVNLTVRVGSRHENYGETGMAHLLEHLVFKGTPTTRNAWAEFTKRGLRANGTTWIDRTNYFASFGVNDESLDWYIGWLADAMVNSFISADDLKSEMTVVRNEMESGENNPGRILFQRLLSTMYDWHAYGKSTIGARSDVENVDISRLQAFYRRYYQPDNATVIVAGRFDEAQVLSRIARTFGALPRPSRALPPTYTLDPAQDGERTVTLRRVGGTPMLYAGFHIPPASHPDFAAAELLAQVLGDTPAGRLHRALVDTQLAAGTFSWAMPAAEPGALVLGAQLAPGQDVAQARTALLGAIGAVAGAEPVTAAELARAKTQLLNAWEKGFADPERIGVELSGAIALGDWRLYFVERDRVRAATLADVQRVARERLLADNRTLALYEPTAAPQRAPAPARVDVAAVMKDFRGDAGSGAVAAFDASPANLQRLTQRGRLASGLQTALLPKPTRGSLVSARLRLHLGTGATLAGQETVSGLVAGLLSHGAAGMTRQEIADRFDALRADVSFGGSGQTVSVGVRTVREHLPETIRLIGRILREPTFPEASLEEARKNGLAGLAEQRDEPEAVLSNALQRHGNPYPRGDLRYAATFDEQEADLRAVTAAQLRDFHRRFYSAAHGEFAAVGDFDPDAVRRALDEAFGRWSQPAAGPQPYERLQDPLVPVAPQVLTLRTPDKKNAVFQARLALPLDDRDPDFAALALANRIFGSGGSSRLWSRVREREGLSYDIGTAIDWNPREANSPLSGWAIFAPGVRAQVEAAWREELARSLKDGFTQAELDQAKQGVLQTRALQRAQDDVLAGMVLSQLELQRDFLRQQAIDEQLRAVTLAQVNDAWRRRVADPSRWVIGFAGDFGTP